METHLLSGTQSIHATLYIFIIQIIKWNYYDYPDVKFIEFLSLLLNLVYCWNYRCYLVSLAATKKKMTYLNQSAQKSYK